MASKDLRTNPTKRSAHHHRPQKDAYPQKVLNKLYTTTDLQKNFNVNMLALVDGIDPQTLSLKGILEHYVAQEQCCDASHQIRTYKSQRSRTHSGRAEKALDHINEVIETIKKSPTKEDAHANLVKKFRLSDKQASAILEMRLQTLAGLERKKSRMS